MDYLEPYPLGLRNPDHHFRERGTIGWQGVSPQPLGRKTGDHECPDHICLIEASLYRLWIKCIYIYNMFLSYRWIQWDTWCTYLHLVGSLNHLLRCASSNPWTHLSYHIWLQVLSLDLCGRSMVGTKHYNVGFLHGNLILFTIEENSKLPLPHLPPHILGWNFGPSF